MLKRLHLDFDHNDQHGFILVNLDRDKIDSLDNQREFTKRLKTTFRIFILSCSSLVLA